jgi:Fur family transcriptional regulator, ferric uptake regulator
VVSVVITRLSRPRRESISSPAVNDSAHAAETKLRKAGLRRTPVRVSVLELLERSGRPMSVPQILGKLRGVDTVTVYRTLGTFVGKRLVHRVRGEDRTWMYAPGGAAADGTPQHKHPHFVCDECGKVECLEQAEIPRGFVQSLGVGEGYAVSYPEVVLHGVCPKCRA